MLISEKHKFVFFCMQKCASVSIEDMLGPFSDIHFRGTPAFRHTNFMDFQEFVQPYLRKKSAADDFDTICIVREPVSWLYSWYRFRARHQLRDPSHPNHMASTAGLSFTDFLEAHMCQSPPPYASVGTQFDFVRNKGNEVGIRTIFPYEALEQFVIYMSDVVGVRLKLGHKNVSPRKMHSSLVERISAANRGIQHRLGLGRYTTVGLRDRGLVEANVLPAHLLEALRRHSLCDFELYEAARRKCRIT